MAAPHVSAALALLESKYPSKTSTEIQSLLLSSLDIREPLQCAGECSQYPGAEAIEGSEGMCLRPCGGGLLNLANIANE
jgi:serine protease